MVRQILVYRWAITQHVSGWSDIAYRFRQHRRFFRYVEDIALTMPACAWKIATHFPRQIMHLITTRLILRYDALYHALAVCIATQEQQLVSAI